MKRFCICAVSDEEYQWYIPLFLHSLVRFHPEIQPLVFITFPCGDKLKEMINFLVYENAWQQYLVDVSDIAKQYGKYQYSAAASRFVEYGDLLQNYEFVLCTDVDMLINESYDIVSRHLDKMKSDNTWYYENFLTVTGGKGYRLAGVHFVTQYWWDATYSERNRYREKLIRDYKESPMTPTYRTLDEEILYNVAKNSGLGIPPISKGEWRHHGIHLGDWKYSIEKGFKHNPSIENLTRIKLLYSDEIMDAVSCISRKSKNYSYLKVVVNDWKRIVSA